VGKDLSLDLIKKNQKKHTVQARLLKLEIRRGTIRLKFDLSVCEGSVQQLSLILRSAVKEKSYDFVLTNRQLGERAIYDAQLPLDQVEWEQFYWDIRGSVILKDQKKELRIKNRSWLQKIMMLISGRQIFLQDKTYVVYPYLTNSNDPAIQYRTKSKQDSKWFVWKEYIALMIYFLLRPYWLSKKIWLIYEKYSITAQDNSYYFFRYCQEKLTENEKRNIYYVIDKKASDYRYVKQYDKRVIQFLSLRHMIYLKAAQLLISSDTKAHAYAWHSPNTIYRAMLKTNKNVFLQHGVIYYKQCHKGLRKSGTNNCRLFIVSSEIEKKIIKRYFGYRNNEIAVTGLARWDVLRDTSMPGERMILVMPTWRSWLEEVPEEEFKKSEYYKNYMNFLNDPKLQLFLQESETKMVFYIHPKFREYMNAFATTSPWIELVEFGSRPLNELIMKCNMMITDYSSACWDVYYQGKPVVFYVFDLDMYDRVQGSYVDMRTQAFGDAVDTMEDVIGLLEYYFERGFKEKDQYAGMRKELLPYCDHLNCERIYHSIKRKF
jgi:CDP-glycerol glycerophosphotransferase (TagB/SpsB family)